MIFLLVGHFEGPKMVMRSNLECPFVAHTSWERVSRFFFLIQTIRQENVSSLQLCAYIVCKFLTTLSSSVPKRSVWIVALVDFMFALQNCIVFLHHLYTKYYERAREARLHWFNQAMQFDIIDHLKCWYNKVHVYIHILKKTRLFQKDILSVKNPPVVYLISA